MAGDDDTKSIQGKLHKRTMADGGEVYSGALAREALRAVDARAMTMDHTIFVDDDFDPDDPEDQALYAHELHHQQTSGGVGEHGGGHDAEEHAARAIESMVLHRRAQGEDFGSVMRDVRSGAVPTAPGEDGSSQGPLLTEQETSDPRDPMNAYRAMRAKGMSHDAIVDMLARHVVNALLEGDEERAHRASTSTGIL